MQRRLAIFAVVLALSGAITVFLFQGRTAAPPTKFVLLDGSSLSTEDLRGNVALVNFWATSCTTCVAEMPQLIQTYEKYKHRGYRTVAVANEL